MRKAPRQQRSRVTVDVIVEAATRVLARRGWARFTTNEIAAVAGVSVGSLYQYFPNKLAIAEAIRQRHLDEVLVALSSAGDDNEAVSLDQRVTRFADGVIAAHSVDEALHRVLLDEVPLVARSSYAEFEAEYQRRYRALIAASANTNGGAGDDETAARVLSSAVEGVVHAAAHRGDLGLPALRSELVRLILAYLRDRQQAA
ncbi:TetR/AcrR family transcriptional regulator [Variovorax paradoxus]|uniref:TetR/AcrR family transcriptional regulator n=1 Tax=Variovorax paradoxus TaxID=34073 RepID=UPI0021AC2A6C|nr:TetR/AcrR family transcriptional regulator [Variovorax paradoxus]UVH58474.1 TetR/AcrR family transcriptional regulator [Variovorax paradoxus]